MKVTMTVVEVTMRWNLVNICGLSMYYMSNKYYTHHCQTDNDCSFMEDNSGISGLLEESLVVEAQDVDLVIPVEMS